MSESLAERQLLIAVLAAHLGFVSEETACDAIAAAQAQQDVSLEGHLDAIGQLSSRQIRLLEDLADERMAHSAPPVWSWCAERISPSFLLGLRARGLQSCAEQLFLASSARAGNPNDQSGTVTRDRSLMETAQADTTPASNKPTSRSLSSAADFEVTQVSAPALPPDRYRIVREFAQGGLGTISVAEDVPLEREVAFKEIRPERANDERSQTRFRIEARITGRLEHPSIVPVYDVGTRETGQPFYVMRLIQGESMKDVLSRFWGNDESSASKSDAQTNENKTVPPRERRERNIEFRDLLSRFVDVCQAVAYAHEHGVIHRDLKPANIMLGKFGETLLVDWGLAKALDGSDPAAPDDLTATFTESTAPNLTVAGTAIGTPSFMSPEQAAGDIDRISTSSDIYGLGATLFAIITGRRPVTASSTAEVIQRVRDGRLEVHESAAPANVPAALWAICRKAMQPRQRDRYGSAADLMHDVERYLADEPVSAMREPLFSRARRWIRHHSTLVSTASAICLMAIVSLSIGLSVYAGLSNRLETSNGQLAASNRQLEDTNTQLSETNQRLETSIAAEQHARTEAEARLFLAMNSVDTYLSEITDNLELQRPDLQHLRRNLLANALPFFQQLRQMDEGNSEVEFMRAKASIRLSAIHDELANTDQAAADIAQAIGILETIANDNPDNSDYLFHLAVAQNNQGTLLMNAGKFAESREALEATLETRERLAGFYPDEFIVRRDRARTLTNLALVCAADAQFKEAIDLHAQAIELRLENLAATDSAPEAVYELANSYSNMGVALVGDDQVDASRLVFEQAVELYQGSLEALTARYDWTLGYASALASLGSSHYSRGELAQAEEIRGRTVTVFRDLEKSYPYAPQVQRGLANALIEHGKVISETQPTSDFLATGEEALRIYDSISSVYRDDFNFRKDVAYARHAVGYMFRMRGETARAREMFRQSAEILKPLIESLPQDSHEQLMLRNNLADAMNGEAGTLSDSGDHAAAADLYADIAQIRGALGALLSDKVTQWGAQADALHNAAMERQALQQSDEARRGYEQALAVRARLLLDHADDTYLLSQQATTHNGLAIMLGSLDDLDGARRHYERCLALCDQIIALQGNYYLEARVTAAGAISNLARVELREGNTDKAKERYTEAIESLEATLVERPGDPSATQFLSITLQARAAMQAGQGEFSLAADDWCRAGEVSNPIHLAYYKLYEAICRAQAGEVEEAVALARENEGNFPDLRYLGAKVNALSVKQTEDESKQKSLADVAITILQELEQSEFFAPNHVDELKTNSDWDALREDERFIQLLERVSGEGGPGGTGGRGGFPRF